MEHTLIHLYWQVVVAVLEGTGRGDHLVIVLLLATTRHSVDEGVDSVTLGRLAEDVVLVCGDMMLLIVKHESSCTTCMGIELTDVFLHRGCGLVLRQLYALRTRSYLLILKAIELCVISLFTCCRGLNIVIIPLILANAVLHLI